MLFLILGPRRKQELFTINIDNIIFPDNKVMLLPNKTLKHTNPKVSSGKYSNETCAAQEKRK